MSYGVQSFIGRKIYFSNMLVYQSWKETSFLMESEVGQLLSIPFTTCKSLVLGSVYAGWIIAANILTMVISWRCLSREILQSDLWVLIQQLRVIVNTLLGWDALEDKEWNPLSAPLASGKQVPYTYLLLSKSWIHERMCMKVCKCRQEWGRSWRLWIGNWKGLEPGEEARELRNKAREADPL